LKRNKRKIINDPVYGFINIYSELVFDLVEHPYFQRLRHIKQLGLTNYVYPGANHTRFQHSLGTLYLLDSAINIIRSKGHEITHEEAEATTIALLLHDIGHGPFSHALEENIINISHEKMSELYMEELNAKFNNRLTLAIDIFRNKYQKKFLHELVSSQLDMDRLDYLKRDSFFSGVTEGVIGSDRIIKMLDVVDDKLVVESKGIYSIEKFLIARRLMYWQVYLHKTVLAAEYLMLQILKRVRELYLKGFAMHTTNSLEYFLHHNINPSNIKSDNSSKRKNILDTFSNLDDNDIMACVKSWKNSTDKVLSMLCQKLLNRKLFKIRISNEPFSQSVIDTLKQQFLQKYSQHNMNNEEANYFIFTDIISNNAYSKEDENIQILYSNGVLKDVAEASDMLNMSALSKTIKKYFLCYPKELDFTQFI
jgi:hypothetical protein